MNDIPSLSAATNLLKALAHESRLGILYHLIDRERSVSEISHALNIGQAAVSAQLMRLRAERLVSSRREGRNIYYRLERKDVAAVILALGPAFETSLDMKKVARRGS